VPQKPKLTATQAAGEGACAPQLSLGPKNSKHTGKSAGATKTKIDSHPDPGGIFIGESMTREEIIAAVKECAAKLGHAPSLAEFRRHTNISKGQVRKNFGTYSEMMAASEVERHGSGSVVSLKTLFLDWARIVRKLGRIPSMSHYEVESKYTVRPMIRRFRTWSSVPQSMLEYARREGLEGEWNDVLMIIGDHLKGVERRAQISEPAARILAQPGTLTDEPIFGQPMHAPLSCAPTNEGGVLFAFGSVARDLGFSVLRIQSEFPDCHALRYVGNHKWQWTRIEFEHESRNFLTHMHPVSGCDLIVCWRHNWPECPLEVLELQSVFEKNLGLAANERE
jgi:hypothetical protein